ncbi:trichothecene 3-O-acetyltransferase [Podospora aff. communis PSN243]|uniref:Trichothecene 3-O-acetyltransferase n=1 Tax=Podospora aff. communis PSN243 TaxID=3040156 RepID=A0AAV9GVL9_9PEZI|nr:trichothecene 3-O-acetyltransferase [Podospora aff. communis PSN243]
MFSTSTTDGSHTVLLSPLDNYMPRIYVILYLVFHTPDTSAAVDALQAGVEKLGSQLPFLRGSVSTSDDSRGQMAITWSPSDPPLSLHSTPSLGTNPPSYDQLKSENAPLRYFANTFPALLRPRTGNNPGAPAFAASYTPLDTAVVLGIAVHHGLSDGTGVSEIIRFFASCTSGISPPEFQSPHPDEPLLRRQLIHSALPSAPTKSLPDRLASLPEFYLLSAASLPQQVDTSAPKGNAKLFTFPLSKIEDAKGVLRIKGVEPAALTVNNILTAVIWACIVRARAARRGNTVLGNGASKMGFAVNARGIFTGTITQQPYLGNVNLFGLVEVPCTELERIGGRCLSTGTLEDLGPVIEGMYKAARRVTGEHVAEVVAMMEEVGDVRDVAPNWVRSNGADLSVTSWANMGVYESDFGERVGRPVFMRVPEFESDGLVVVLPRKREGREEKIEVVLLLCEEDLEFLEGDEVWRSWVG